MSAQSSCGCGRLTKAKGLCSACYQRFRRGTIESARLAHRAANRQYRLTHPNYRKSRQGVERRRRYGLSDTDYNKLLQASKGRCELCSIETKELCIDHNHSTGVVRGLLCHDCNKGLGHYEKMLRLGPNLAAYLERTI